MSTFCPRGFPDKNLVTKLHFIVVNYLIYWAHPAFTSLRHHFLQELMSFFCPTSCGVYINKQNSYQEKNICISNELIHFKIFYWKPSNISKNVWHNWTSCSLFFWLKKNACGNSPKRLFTVVSCFAVVSWQLFASHTYH